MRISWACLNAVRELHTADQASVNCAMHDVQHIDYMLRQLLHTQIAGIAMADMHDDCDGTGAGLQHNSGLTRISGHGSTSSRCCGLPNGCQGHNRVDGHPPKYLRWKEQMAAALKACERLSEADRRHALAHLELAATRWHALRCQPQAWMEQRAHIPVDIERLEPSSSHLRSEPNTATGHVVERSAAAVHPGELPTTSVQNARQDSTHGRPTARFSCSASPTQELLSNVKRAKARAAYFQCMQRPSRPQWQDSTLLPMEKKHRQGPRRPEDACPLPRPSTAVRL
jgi:hypothetical protein